MEGVFVPQKQLGHLSPWETYEELLYGKLTKNVKVRNMGSGSK